MVLEKKSWLPYSTLVNMRRGSGRAFTNDKVMISFSDTTIMLIPVPPRKGERFQLELSLFKMCLHIETALRILAKQLAKKNQQNLQDILVHNSINMPSF